MATWVPVQTNNGVVVTRRPHNMMPGELVSASNVRYSRGDAVQMRRDYGHVLHSEHDYDILDVHYLGIEAAADYLLGLMRVPTDDQGSANYSLGYAEAASTGTWTPVYELDGAADRIGVVHIGAQFFIGDGKGPGVLLDNPRANSSPGTRFVELSMKTPKQAGLITDADHNYVQDSSGGTVRNTWTFKGPQKIKPMFDNTYFNVTGIPMQSAEITAFPTAANLYVYLYFVTEYDKNLDVESQPYYAGLVTINRQNENGNYTQFFATLPYAVYKSISYVSGQAVWPSIRVSNYVKVNSRATHLRVYRQYIGNFNGAELSSVYRDVLNYYAAVISSGVRHTKTNPSLLGPQFTFIMTDVTQNAFVSGGLVGEIELTGSSLLTFQDTIHDLTADGPGLQWEYHLGTAYIQEPPRPWNIGMVLQDSIVLNQVDNPSVLQHSRPGEYEYFPLTNQLPIVTRGEDEVINMFAMGGVGIIFTRDNVHQLRYVPTGEDAEAEPFALVSTDGLVATKAATTITLPQGMAVVWLGSSQLNMTTGEGSINACEDWSVDGAGLLRSRLSDSILVNNIKAERLELWCHDATGQVVYHFYYARGMLKPGGLKCTGPHTGIHLGADQSPDNASMFEVKAIAVGSSGDADSPLWFVGNRYSYMGNSGTKLDPIRLRLRQLSVERAPVGRIAVMQAALHHTQIQSTKRFYLNLASKAFGRSTFDLKRVDFLGTSAEEYDTATVTGVSGNHISPELVYEGLDDVTFGPLWMEMEGAEDGR